MAVEYDKLAVLAEFTPGQVIHFTYRNWQGVVAERTVRAIGLTYGATEWHPEPQWLLEAFDFDRNDTRLFAIQDMTPISPERLSKRV